VKKEEKMSGRENEQINPKRAERDEVEVDTNPTTSEQQQAMTSEVDDILDEIDATLEENAAAFVAAFVQKGGQ
jgi:prokaryotic ubiquitin-like protein Pup